MSELKWNCTDSCTNSKNRKRKNKIWVGEITVEGKVIHDATLLLSDEELAVMESEAEECGINLDAYLRLIAMVKFADPMKGD